MNRLALTFICSLLASSSFSQLDFNGGLSIGAITSQVQGDSYGGFNKLGVCVGPNISVGWTEKWAMKMELLYSQKGSRNNPNTKNGDFTFFKLKLNYIEVPISLVRRFEAATLEAGLYYGILLSSSQDTGSGDLPITPPYNSYDIGGQLSASYQFSESISIGIRTSGSLLPMRSAPSNSVVVGWDASGYNSALYLLLGFSI
jgi:hypothetical protein